MMTSQLTERSQLLRWCAWFSLGNVILFWLVGLNYLYAISWSESVSLVPHIKMILTVFTSVTYLGQLALLAVIPGFAIFVLAVVFPRRYFIFFLGILIAATALSLLIVDITIYNLYRFHLNHTIFNLILHSWNNGIFDLSSYEKKLCALIAIGVLLLEWIFAAWVWRNKRKVLPGIVKWVPLFLTTCLYFSYLLICLNMNTIVSRFMLDTAQVFPLYTDIFGMWVPGKNGKMGVERLGEFYPTQMPQPNAPLHYPLHALQHNKNSEPMNLVVIVIDSWRFDMLNSTVTPYLSQFGKKSWEFTNHFSGGDATGPGIFSFFYGLPANYWTAMEAQKKSPLLMDELMQQQYRLGIFSSTNLYAPAFNQTVFRNVVGLNSKEQNGQSPYARDQEITKKFIQFVENNQQQPFFSFLFYDVAHGYCAVDETLQPFKPAIKVCNRAHFLKKIDPMLYFNRYKNALLLVDQQVKQVIEALKRQDLLDNTVVVITGDHGEEFDDNQLGFWHHASNFTRYQVQTPLIVYWPGKKPRTYSHLTSHFDIAPTLMKRLLGCRNPAADYSDGMDLLDKRARPFLIVGSYIDYGIVEKTRITHVLSGGNIEVELPNAKPIPGAKVDVALLQNVFRDLKRFYQ